MGSLKQKSGQDSTWGSNNTTFNSSTPKKEEIKTNDY
jgi:hypothetical protein